MVRGKCLSGQTIVDNSHGYEGYSHIIELSIFSAASGRVELSRWSFIWDRSAVVSRYQADKGTDIVVLLICETSAGQTSVQYWLVLTVTKERPIYERLGLMSVDRSTPEGFDAARLFEDAAEDTQVTIA